MKFHLQAHRAAEESSLLTQSRPRLLRPSHICKQTGWDYPCLPGGRSPPSLKAGSGATHEKVPAGQKGSAPHPPGDLFTAFGLKDSQLPCGRITNPPGKRVATSPPCSGGGRGRNAAPTRGQCPGPARGRPSTAHRWTAPSGVQAASWRAPFPHGGSPSGRAGPGSWDWGAWSAGKAPERRILKSEYPKCCGLRSPSRVSLWKAFSVLRVAGNPART